jgi:hypothetical protein
MVMVILVAVYFIFGSSLLKPPVSNKTSTANQTSIPPSNQLTANEIVAYQEIGACINNNDPELKSTTNIYWNSSFTEKIGELCTDGQAYAYGNPICLLYAACSSGG